VVVVAAKAVEGAVEPGGLAAGGGLAAPEPHRAPYRCARDQVPAVSIHHGGRLAAHPANREVTLEVDTPECVGRTRCAARSPTWPDQALAREDLGECADGRKLRPGIAVHQHGPQLLRPGAAGPNFPQRLLIPSVGLETLEPLVARLVRLIPKRRHSSETLNSPRWCASMKCIPSFTGDVSLQGKVHPSLPTTCHPCP
jgi:hypothetical protein